MLNSLKETKHFYLENYITVFEKGIGRYFFNSIVVCALSLIIALLVSACAAYPISRLKFKFNQYLFHTVINGQCGQPWPGQRKNNGKKGCKTPVFIIFQEKLMEGMTVGAVKG